jgi:hypothetical protein
MYRFYVALDRVANRITDEVFPASRLTLGSTGMIHTYLQEQTNEREALEYDKKQILYAADCYSDAVAFAKLIAAKNPGCSYLVLTASHVFVCTPGPVVEKIYNEKGLVPA